MSLSVDPQRSPAPRGVERPLFVVGAPRSDSASLFEILARARSLHTANGRDFRQLTARIAPLHPSRRAWNSERLTAADATPAIRAAIVKSLYRELRDRNGKQAEGTVRFLDRTPKNALCVPFLDALFPDAMFVLIYRDPRATLQDMAEAWKSGRFITNPSLPGWGGPPWSLALTPGWRELRGKPLPEIVAAQWRTTMEILLDDLEQLPPDRWCVTSTDRLRDDPQSETARICAFAGLEFDDRLPSSVVKETLPVDPSAQRQAEEAVEPFLASCEPVAARARALFASPPGRTKPLAGIAATEAPFRSVSTASFASILAQLGASLVVTTYQSGRVILVRNDGGKLNTHLRQFASPMGVAIGNGRIALGTKREVWEFRNQPEVGRKLPDGERNDACFLPRAMHVTGDIRIHEVGFAGGELWGVNTRFSTLCTFDGAHSFVPRWRPKFVTHLSPDDRCHLNGMAIVDDRIRWVTALGETNEAGGWRARKATGGIIIDVDSGEIVVRGLSMPHSPRFHDGKLWFLESGRGALSVADPSSGRTDTVIELPGFTRGLAFAGPFAFIGLSQVRESNVFGGLPLTDRNEPRQSGVWIVDLRTASVAGFLRFEDLVQEIFDVQVLHGMRFPELLEPSADAITGSFALPTAALGDVFTGG